MRSACWPSSSPSVSAARFFAATFLLSTPPTPSSSRPAAATAAALLLANPKLLQQQSSLAFATSLSQGVLSRSSSSCSSSNNNNNNGNDERRSRRSAAGRGRASVRRARSTAATMESSSDTDSNNGGGSGGNGTVPSLPAFLEKCALTAREQQRRSREGSAATAPAASAAGAEEGAAAPGAMFHVFSGNEACDADSICSAICMAFFRHYTADAATAAASCTDGSAVVYIPVMPIPRADLALRREVLVLFELCGVDPSAVVFSDELDLSALQAEERLRLTLVDHNAVSGRLLSGLGGSVVEIVDHHADLGEHTDVQGAARDIAFGAGDHGSGKALVGSCCTLVAERMLDRAPALLSSDVARLLLGVILVDTINLDKDAKRATERDIAAATELSRRVSWRPSSASQDELFDTLRNAKFDTGFWKELSVADCLRYDYKRFQPAVAVGEKEEGSGGNDGSSRDSGKDSGKGHGEPDPLAFGMSSVLCRLDTLAEKGGGGGGSSGEAVAAFAAAHGVDSLAIMTATLDGDDNMKKELLVFTHTKQRCDQMLAYFGGPKGEFLKLEAAAPPGQRFGGDGGGGDEPTREGESTEPDGWFLRWEMGNVRASRKQVAPSIASFYESASRN